MKKKMWLQLLVICVLMLIALVVLVGPTGGKNIKYAGGKEIVYAPAYVFDEREMEMRPPGRQFDIFLFPRNPMEQTTVTP